MTIQHEAQQESLLPAVLRDARILQGIAQIIFVIIVVLVLSDLGARINGALEATDQAPNLEFLQNKAGFDLADSGSYVPEDKYIDAFGVGFINTMRVVIIGLASTTVIGILFGIFLLSSNFLVRTLARGYVEILRNTPILLQIYAWFFVVIFALPSLQEAITIPQEGIRTVPIAKILISLVIFGFVWAYTRGLRNKVLQSRIRQGAVVVIILANVFGIIGIGQGTPVTFIPGIYISIKSVAIFELIPSAMFGIWMVFVAMGIVVAVALWRYDAHIIETTGRPIARVQRVIVTLVLFTVIGWMIVGMRPTPAEIPIFNEDTEEIVMMPYDDAFESGLLTIEQELEYSRQPLLYRPPMIDSRGRNIETGIEFLPAYLAVFLGLVVYTSAFIAEIVRAGIQAVPKGQIEASKAVGLSQGEMLRLIILPQALRVILPPMGNQYLNFAKNSSLAIAVSYTDIFQVTNTIINQSGQSVTGIIMVMLAYLVISLVISFMMNLINQRFQLVTR